MAIQGQQGRRLGKAMSSMWPDEVAKWRERERERCVKGEREGKERVIKKRETSLEKKKERRKREKKEMKGEEREKIIKKKKKKEFFIIAFVTVPFQIWNGIVHPCQIIWHLEHLM